MAMSWGPIAYGPSCKSARRRVFVKTERREQLSSQDTKLSEIQLWSGLEVLSIICKSRGPPDFLSGFALWNFASESYEELCAEGGAGVRRGRLDFSSIRRFPYLGSL